MLWRANTKDINPPDGFPAVGLAALSRCPAKRTSSSSGAGPRARCGPQKPDSGSCLACALERVYLCVCVLFVSLQEFLDSNLFGKILLYYTITSSDFGQSTRWSTDATSLVCPCWYLLTQGIGGMVLFDLRFDRGDVSMSFGDLSTST